MADEYFVLRRGSGEAYGLVKRVWTSSDGETVDGLDFYRMGRGGWTQDNTAFEDISGQAGDAAGVSITLDEARQVAERLYSAGIYDYAPAVRESG